MRLYISILCRFMGYGVLGIVNMKLSYCNVSDRNCHDPAYFRQFAMGRVNFAKAILTTSPADLARAVAEVLKLAK